VCRDRDIPWVPRDVFKTRPEVIMAVLLRNMCTVRMRLIFIELGVRRRDRSDAERSHPSKLQLPNTLQSQGHSR